jgi:hypothetical protein
MHDGNTLRSIEEGKEYFVAVAPPSDCRRWDSVENMSGSDFESESLFESGREVRLAFETLPRLQPHHP